MDISSSKRAENGSMVSIATSTTTNASSTANSPRSVTGSVKYNNNTNTVSRGSAQPPPLKSNTNSTTWQLNSGSDSVPRLISEKERHLVEHYSPTDPYYLYESPGDSLQFSLKDYHLEHCDHDNDDPYVYRSFFYGREHKNLLGFHPDLGSISISVRKELDKSKSGGSYLYRGILRTAEKFTYVVKTENELNLSTKQKIMAKISTKDVMIAMFPACESAKMKEIDDPKLSFELLTIEEKMIEKNYKFGVVYCRYGQTKEDEMLSNERGSEAFERFLRCIGEKTRLKGYKGFRGGLDVKDDTTGTESFVANFRTMKIMFHVSTLLPYSNTNSQQIQRKSQIGNDICIIVFKEAGSQPYPLNPTEFVSQFNHAFIVVEEVKSVDGAVRYRVATSRKDDVPAFGPYPPSAGYFEPNACLRDFILAKLINGENAAYHSQKFSQLRSRTRKTLLEDLTKTFLRKASLGSTSSLATWKSLFGTNENLARTATVGQSRDSLNIAAASGENKYGKTNSSLLLAPKQTETLIRRKSIGNEVNDLKGGMGRRVSNSMSSPTTPVSPSSTTLVPESLNLSTIGTIRTSKTDSVPMGSPRTVESYNTFPRELHSQPQSPVTIPYSSSNMELLAELNSLRDENSLLKKKLEVRAAEHVNALLAQQSELKVKIELHETKIKLLKALAFVESLSSEGAQFVKISKEISPQAQK